MRAQVRLLVCVGPRCDAQGGGRAQLAAIERALAGTFPDALADGRLAIATRDCLRLCTSDPVVRLEPSGEALAGPQLDDLLRLVGEALAAARPERVSEQAPADQRGGGER